MHSDALVDVESGEMVSHIDVLGPGTIPWVVGNLNSTAVVLENPATDFDSCSVNRVAQFLHLLENPNNRKGVLYSDLVVERAMMDCSWDAQKRGIQQ
jgi:hypothetical protein